MLFSGFIDLRSRTGYRVAVGIYDTLVAVISVLDDPYISLDQDSMRRISQSLAIVGENRDAAPAAISRAWCVISQPSGNRILDSSSLRRMNLI